MSLSRGAEVNRESNLIKTPNRETDEDDGPLCSIKFLEGGGESIYGSIVAGGAIFCMKRAGACTTAPHARLKGFAEILPGEKDEVWLVMAKNHHVYRNLLSFNQTWEHPGQKNPWALKIFRYNVILCRSGCLSSK